MVLEASLTRDIIEEFVAHSASVNCLKIGRKSSRVLVTGGEDHKVNLWAIGKPNAILVSSILFHCNIFILYHSVQPFASSESIYPLKQMDGLTESEYSLSLVTLCVATASSELLVRYSEYYVGNITERREYLFLAYCLPF